MKVTPNDGLIRTHSIDTATNLIATSPQAMADILNNSNSDFQIPANIRYILSRFLGWGLLASEGDQHKMQRRAVAPAFQLKNIKALYPLMWDKTMLLLALLEEDIKRNPASGTLDEGKVACPGFVDLSGWTLYIYARSLYYVIANKKNIVVSRWTSSVLLPWGGIFKRLQGTTI